MGNALFREVEVAYQSGIDEGTSTLFVEDSEANDLVSSRSSHFDGQGLRAELHRNVTCRLFVSGLDDDGPVGTQRFYLMVLVDGVV